MYTKRLRTYKKMGFEIISGNHQVIMVDEDTEICGFKPISWQKSRIFLYFRESIAPLSLHFPGSARGRNQYSDRYRLL